MKVLITSDTRVPETDNKGFALYRLDDGKFLVHPDVMALLLPLFDRAGVTIEESPPGHAVLTEQSRGAFLSCV